MTVYKCDPGKNKDCAGRLGINCMSEGYCFSTLRREFAEETADGQPVIQPVIALEIDSPSEFHNAVKEMPGKPGGE